MSPEKFSKLSKYYLDCLLEDDSSSNSIFASGHHGTEYAKIGQPELTHRDVLKLSNQEKTDFLSLKRRMEIGNQRKSWWYGYPTHFRWIHGKNNWQGGMLDPLFIVPLEYDSNTDSVEINVNAVRINTSAFTKLGLAVDEAQQVATELGFYDQNSVTSSLYSITNDFIQRNPQYRWQNPAQGVDFTRLTEDQTGIYQTGIIFSKEASQFTQGLEFELKKISEAGKSDLLSSALSRFLDSNTAAQSRSDSKEIFEAIPLNETQRLAVINSLKNRLTVITGPPGTGKSQVVASIIINAALQGKRVLFASKNHKAVDVVEHRLNQLAGSPFLIRLGKRGTDDRNIQLELTNYLNGLLGATGNASAVSRMTALKSRIDAQNILKNKIKSEFDKYRVVRLSAFDVEKRWNEVKKDIGEEKSIIRLEWAKKIVLNDEFTLWPIFSGSRKSALEYARMLQSIESVSGIEKLSEEMSKVETEINECSEEYFKLWVNETPGRLKPNDLQTISNYTSILQQMAGLGEGTSRQIWARLFSEKDRLMSTLAGILPAWCVVNLSVRGQLPLLAGFFDLVVIDEASQCDIPSALPLIYRGKQVVIIGDPNQLQHISAIRTGRSVELMSQHELDVSDDASFEYSVNSLYKLAASRLGPNELVMLDEHFRSHSDIISFSNEFWYHGRLTIGTDYNRLNPVPIDTKPAIEWIDVAGSIVQEGGSGAMNIKEIDAVVSKVKEIVASGKFTGDIGIVTPFRLQANKIREKLVTQIDESAWAKYNIVVDTAVRFQGDERDIMLFSPVVSTNIPKGPKYYLSNTPNLFNVALTRARAKLIVIGNKSACLSSGISHVESFAQYHDRLIDKNTNRSQATSQFDTYEEQILYNALKNKGVISLPQYVIGQYRLDLAVISGNKKIDIEADGFSVHADYSGQRIKSDVIRNQHLQRQGWKVIRFWNYEINDNLDYCVKKVIDELQR